jgi:hypothetical protein
MLIAKIENGAVVNVADHTALLPDTSFGAGGPTLAQIQELGFAQVTLWKPYFHAFEKLVSCSPYIEDGMVYCVTVEPLTAEEIQAQDDAIASQARSERNQKLTESDWTQIIDANLDESAKIQWREYRQALRDLTGQVGFPHEIVWPTKPGASDQLTGMDTINGI